MEAGRGQKGEHSGCMESVGESTVSLEELYIGEDKDALLNVPREEKSLTSQFSGGTEL